MGDDRAFGARGLALRYVHGRFRGVSTVVSSLGERSMGVESVDLRGVWSGRQDSNQTVRPSS